MPQAQDGLASCPHGVALWPESDVEADRLRERQEVSDGSEPPGSEDESIAGPDGPAEASVDSPAEGEARAGEDQPAPPAPPAEDEQNDSEDDPVVIAAAAAAAQAVPAAQAATKAVKKKKKATSISPDQAARDAKPERMAAELDDDDDMMAPPKEEPPKGAPGWVTTFADLMSLLMCFFVMLFSMSNLELTTFKEMVQSVKRGFGHSQIQDLEEFPIEQVLTEAQILAAAGRERSKKNAAELRELLKQEITDGKIEVEQGDQQITIQILQAGSFSSGSATLKKGFSFVAKKIQESLGSIQGAITVAGHTDNTPLNSKKFRSNWELSSARAFSVIHALLKNSELEASRFVLRGFADTRPRVPNDTARNRGKNRRVEIIIDQRDSPLGTDNPDNLETMVINADNIGDFESTHVKPVNQAVPTPAAPKP